MDDLHKIMPFDQEHEYEIHEIAGHKIVLQNGGTVKTLKLVSDISTSDVISRIKALD